MANEITTNAIHNQNENAISVNPGKKIRNSISK